MHVFAAQGYFKCRNGKLIPENQRCNRRYDCDEGDYSDEQKCRKFVNIIRRLILSSLFHLFFSHLILFSPYCQYHLLLLFYPHQILIYHHRNNHHLLFLSDSFFLNDQFCMSSSMKFRMIS